MTMWPQRPCLLSFPFGNVRNQLMRPHTPDWLTFTIKRLRKWASQLIASLALFSYWRPEEISLPAHTMTNVIPNTRMAYLQCWKLKATSLSAPTLQWLTFQLKSKGDQFLRAHDGFGRKALDVDTACMYLSIYLCIYTSYLFSMY